MKGRLAWLCYGRPAWEEESEDEAAEMEIRTIEPNRYDYKKVVPIVYFELEE